MNGERFTGIIRDFYEDGQLASRRRYRDGLPDGLCEEWYPHGQLETRYHAVWGAGISEAWDYRPDGTLRSYRRDERNWPVEIKEWDEHGHLVRDEKRAVPAIAA